MNLSNRETTCSMWLEVEWKVGNAKFVLFNVIVLWKKRSVRAEPQPFYIILSEAVAEASSGTVFFIFLLTIQRINMATVEKYLSCDDD